MFQSSADHHQGAYLFLFKITFPVVIRGDVVMRQHNMHLFYVVFGVERWGGGGGCGGRITTHTEFNVKI
jgi:hypothetical protein